MGGSASGLGVLVTLHTPSGVKLMVSEIGAGVSSWTCSSWASNETVILLVVLDLSTRTSGFVLQLAAQQAVELAGVVSHWGWAWWLDACN